MALKKDGTMLAIKDKIIADMGSTYTVDHSIMASALYIPGVYQIQNYAVDAFGVATNKTTHGSLRGHRQSRRFLYPGTARGYCREGVEVGPHRHPHEEFYSSGSFSLPQRHRRAL